MIVSCTTKISFITLIQLPMFIKYSVLIIIITLNMEANNNQKNKKSWNEYAAKAIKVPESQPPKRLLTTKVIDVIDLTHSDVEFNVLSDSKTAVTPDKKQTYKDASVQIDKANVSITHSHILYHNYNHNSQQNN